MLSPIGWVLTSSRGAGGAGGADAPLPKPGDTNFVWVREWFM